MEIDDTTNADGLQENPNGGGILAAERVLFAELF